MKLLRVMVILLSVLIPSLIFATPAYAIDLPDSTPTVEDVNCYRNILETGDFLIIIYENTPYEDTPSMDYSEAFVWRLFDTDNVTELGQALGYDYNENGYGYNVISFYFDADDAPTWGAQYSLRLSGTPAAFDDPPVYNYEITASDYSGLTATTAVKTAVSALIITTTS